MEYSKKNLAKIQLEKAIELFLKNKDYVSSITLAGASEEITRCVLERKGMKPSITKLKEWFDSTYPDAEIPGPFYKEANLTRNNLKHFTDPNEDMVEVSEKEAVFWLGRAIMNYDWAYSGLSDIMKGYVSWWKEKYA